MSSFLHPGLGFARGLIGSPANLWTPDQPGVTIEAWYNALGNVTSGGFIDSYVDKSINNRDIISDTAPKKPAVGEGFISFDGIDDVIDFSDAIVPTTDFTVFFLARAGTYDATEDISQNYFFTDTGSTRYSLIRTSATAVRVSAGSVLDGSYPVIDGETFLFSATYQLGANNAITYKNAAIYATDTETTLPALSGIRFGGRTNALRIGQFDLYEAFFISSAIDSDYRQRAEGYICHNNGLANLLAADHPYRNSPPTT